MENNQDPPQYNRILNAPDIRVSLQWRIIKINGPPMENNQDPLKRERILTNYNEPFMEINQDSIIIGRIPSVHYMIRN